jgi:predicted enzyme related to lactoylglutathione lyase
MTAVANFLYLTIDANDADRVARFWAELLGTEIEAVWEEGQFVFLKGGEGLPVLCVQRVPEGKAAKNRLHIDLSVDDLAKATDSIVGLGGSWDGSELRLPGVVWRTMRDPEGNEFDIAVEGE